MEVLYDAHDRKVTSPPLTVPFPQRGHIYAAEQIRQDILRFQLEVRRVRKAIDREMARVTGVYQVNDNFWDPQRAIAIHLRSIELAYPPARPVPGQLQLGYHLVRLLPLGQRSSNPHDCDQIGLETSFAGHDTGKSSEQQPPLPRWPTRPLLRAYHP